MAGSVLTPASLFFSRVRQKPGEKKSVSERKQTLLGPPLPPALSILSSMDPLLWEPDPDWYVPWHLQDPDFMSALEMGIRMMLPVCILPVSFSTEEGDRKEGVVKVIVIKVK